MKRFITFFPLVFLLLFLINIQDIKAYTIEGPIGNQIDNFSLSDLTITNASINNENGSIVYRNTLNNKSNKPMIITSRVRLYDTSNNLVEDSFIEEAVPKGDKSYYYTYVPKSYIQISYYKLDVSVSNLDKDYYIESYDVSVDVYENNVFKITETIDAVFLVPKHGLTRTIPTENEIYREDGTYSENRAIISNVDVNDEYIVSKSKYSDQFIRIGNEDKLITGKKHYVIQYYYSIGKDPLPDKDEFYFNLIGTEWDTYIMNASFSVNMPKDFDSSTVGVTSGTYGSADVGQTKYSTDGKIIMGKTTSTLLPNEGLTVRVELDEGYFNRRIDFKMLLEMYKNKYYLLLPILFIFIARLVFRKYGKNEIVDSIEVSPPDGLNSLEVGYIYRASVRREDIISLLIYLANKKYIKIEELNSKSDKDDFRVVKLKDYDGNNEIEKEFMKGLFGNSSKGIVIKRSLANHFYKTIDKISSMLSEREERDKIIDRKAKRSILVYLLLIIITFLFLGKPLKNMILSSNVAIFWIIFVGMAFIILTLASVHDNKTRNVAFIIGMLLTFGFFSQGDEIINLFIFNPAYMIYVIFCLCIVGYLVSCIEKSNKRTKEAEILLGKIMGFKNFLETAEKERLEKLVEQNPNYFYDTLPYAYVLDVSSKWIAKFKDIDVKPPEWYTSTEPFDFKYFDDTINDTLYFSSAPISDSYGGGYSGSGSSGGFSSGGGGGFSGGGFSGGGSGGGGGGSW